VGYSLEGGISIVFMAIIFDRLSLAMSKPRDSGVVTDPSKMVFRLLPQQWVHWRPACIVEKGIDIIWQFFAGAGRLLVGYLSLGVGVLIGAINRDLSEIVVSLMRRRTMFVSGVTIILAIMAWDAWISSIGFFPKAWQFTLRGPVDDAVNWLAVDPTFIGITKGIRAVIYLYILNPLDQFTAGLPWWYVLLAFFIVVKVSVGTGFAIVTVVSLLFTGAAGIWGETMYTLASTVASVAVCVLFGLPLGIVAAYYRPVDAVLRPILDTMQTMPAFVYLIPVLMFFGGNPVTAVIATVIYAIPPMIRMTILGLRELPNDINEVSSAFGSTTLQSLIKVKLPMASPAIMLGVNQAVIMALAMQVITPLVAGLGLGKEVFHGMSLADTGRGLVAGCGIVLLAIVLDRLTQAWTRNQREALGL
jgi:glycine betaine/proline transport system permease protein